MPHENEGEYFKEFNEVITRFIKNDSPFKIAKELGIRKVDVDKHIEAWRKTSLGNELMQARVEELIATMDEHYSMLIQKAYEIVEEVDELRKSDKETMTRSQMLSQKKGAIDLIAKLEKDRIDVLQKSGLLDAADRAEELAEMEAKYDRVMELLEEHLCDKCTAKILGPLQQEFTGHVVVVSGE